MALRAKVLNKKAKKFELKGLQKNKVTPENTSALEELLQDAYVVRCPKQMDYSNRRDLVRVFNMMTKEIYGNSNDIPTVEEFGSFSMDLFSSKSDLDLSVNFSNTAAEFPREKKIQTLRKFAKKLYALQSQGHVSNVHPITTARVPILKVVDHGTGIECDISIENRDGIFKSKIMHMVSSIDERFQKLCFLVKAWAKAHNINSSKYRTLNSLSIILLVAFHFQTRDPPILPPFSALFKDGTNPARVVKLLPNFLNYGVRNKESLAELFVTLLIKLSAIERLWPKGLCASTYEGSWISKTWDSKVGCISVEDFTDRSQNVARAVGTAEVKRIYKCIELSIRYVFSFMDGQLDGPKLREFLFGQDTIPTLVGTGTRKFEKTTTKPCVPAAIQIESMPPTEGWGGTQLPSNPILTKRKRSMGDWEGRSLVNREGTSRGCCGGTEQAIHFDPNLTKKMKYTEGWGGMPGGNWGGNPVEGWGGTQQAMPFDHSLTKKVQPTEGWGQMPAGTWERRPIGNWGGTPTEGWGGTPIKGWAGTPTPTDGWGGRELPVSFDPIRARKMQSIAGWGGKQQSISLHPIRTKEMRSRDGWRRTRLANGEISSNVDLNFAPIPYPGLPCASSLGNWVSSASMKYTSINTNNSVALETPYIPPSQVPCVPLKNTSINQVITMPGVGSLHAKHIRPLPSQNSRQGHPYRTL